MTANRNPAVGIAIANRNKGRYLGACLDSVLGQEYPALKIMVVDDHSTDESMDVLQDYAARYGQVSVIRLETQQGVAGARNTAIRALDSEWVCVMDSDDFYVSPKKISEEMNLVASARSQNVAAYSGVVNASKDGNIIRKYLKTRPPMVLPPI